MWKYIVTFIIISGTCQFSGKVNFSNRTDAIEFHDSINLSYPNRATIDSILNKEYNGSNNN